MLDGFFCALLVQPQVVPERQWLVRITDVDGRALPAGFDASRLHSLARRRYAELDDSIEHRRWFDPWVFELEADDLEPNSDDEDDSGFEAAPGDAVYPWVAGFATAMEVFPALMSLNSPAVIEPLALVYRHLASDDLEDADELMAEIESLEPPSDLGEAVEGLVRATLLLADVGRPQAGQSGEQRRKSAPARAAATRLRPSNR